MLFGFEFFGGDNTESVFGTATPAGPLLALSVLSCSLSIWSVPLILPHPRQTNVDDEYIRISLYMCLFQARPLICINGSFFSSEDDDWTPDILRHADCNLSTTVDPESCPSIPYKFGCFFGRSLATTSSIPPSPHSLPFFPRRFTRRRWEDDPSTALPGRVALSVQSSGSFFNQYLVSPHPPRAVVCSSFLAIPPPRLRPTPHGSPMQACSYPYVLRVACRVRHRSSAEFGVGAAGPRGRRGLRLHGRRRDRRGVRGRRDPRSTLSGVRG